MTSCEGGDLYSIDSPDWISARADSIAAEKAKNQGGEEIEGLHEDVYTIGATDFSTSWWAVFSKYYQIPEGGKWIAQFTLNINPKASNTYKNFALIICNDADRGANREYGAIRYDYQPSGNSEWGDYIDRSLATSTLEFATDTDSGVDQLGGKVTLTIDRSEGGLIVTMTNGKVTKTYTQKSPLVNLNDDQSNTTIRAFLVPEGSYINFIGSTIEPIGGFTSKEDKQPLSMTLNGVPKKVLQGATLEDAFANVTATIQFEQEVSATISAKDLTFQAVPDMNSLGKKTLVAAYAKTYKGEAANAPVIGTAEFEVVDKMYKTLGATDNSTGWWGAHSENIKVGPKETFISSFTNYSLGNGSVLLDLGGVVRAEVLDQHRVRLQVPQEAQHLRHGFQFPVLHQRVHRHVNPHMPQVGAADGFLQLPAVKVAGTRARTESGIPQVYRVRAGGVRPLQCLPVSRRSQTLHTCFPSPEYRVFNS